MINKYISKGPNANLIKFAKYAFIGMLGLVIDMGVFYLLNKVLGLNYVFSNIISSSLAIIHNFLLNSYINFKVTDKPLRRFLLFYGIALIGMIFSTLLLALMIDILHLDSLIAKLISIFIVAIFQYFLNKKITFQVQK